MSRTRTEGAAGLLGDDERLAVLADEGALFAVTARSRDLAAPIPSCPGWTLGDLVAHLGLVYRWVTRVVREERCVPPDQAERVSLQDPDPTDGPALIERVLLAHSDLVQALAAARSDLACWTVWPTTSARTFWIRRQLYETLVHRVDAQNCGTVRVCDDIHGPTGRGNPGHRRRAVPDAVEPPLRR